GEMSGADLMESEIDEAKEAIKSASEKIVGWSFNENEYLSTSIEEMTGLLFKVIEERDARINRLLFKLGQAAEKL
ncbi:unnamed protein product, partial [marine sediment metagenome]